VQIMRSDSDTTRIIPTYSLYEMIQQVESSKANSRDTSLTLAYSLGSREASFTPEQQLFLKEMIGAVSVQASATPTGKHCTIDLHPTDHENKRCLASDWKSDWYRPTFTSLTAIHDPSNSFFTYEPELTVNGTKREKIQITSLGPSEVIVVKPSPGKTPGRQVEAFLAETYHLVDGNKDMIAVSRDNHYANPPDFSAAQWHRVVRVDNSTIGDWKVKTYTPAETA
jgi:hypothetical protein